jgi:hypothetical protein
MSDIVRRSAPNENTLSRESPMRLFIAILLSATLLGLATFAGAQPPGGGKKDGPGKDPLAPGRDTKSFVDRMMAFDKNKDGKLTRDEITDERLLRLFDRADTNKDGVVTREELEALAAKEMQGAGRSGPGGPGGPGGRFGGPDGPGGGPGGFGGPPPIGQVLPPFLRDALEVSDAQRKQLDDLQKEVDSKLAKILTEEQRKRLQELRDRGPGGPGGPVGRFGPPGGRPGGFGPDGPPKKN